MPSGSVAHPAYPARVRAEGPEWETVASLLADDAHLVRAVAAGRQRNRTVPYRRVELRYVDLRSGRHLQIVGYDDTQAHTRNVALADVPGEVDRLLGDGYANWHVDTTEQSVQLRVTKKGRPLLHRGPASEQAPDRGHDLAKRRPLSSDDVLFHALGLVDDQGRVKPSRAAKYRQVQDFLAALEPVVDDVVRAAGRDRPLRMVDLGCGNAYLTFAAHRFLEERTGRAVHAVGVDVKAQARGRGGEVASRLGVGDRMGFVDGTIADVALDERPDLVLALHACDTATDDALARAVGWQAPVVLAAPCCHKDLQRQLRRAPGPSAYSLVTRHGILRERLADVLTDALRAAILRQEGYRVEVIEFVDSAHTPRNALIRAVRTGAPPDEATRAAYDELVRTWGVRPALADRLIPRVG